MQVLKSTEPILSEYILAPGNNHEVLIPLDVQFDSAVVTSDKNETRQPKVVAVYQWTGRGPFESSGKKGYEFKYKFVRIIK